MFVWDAGELVQDGPRFIINFPTKKHWRSKSKLTDIRAGLDDLVRHLEDMAVTTVAVPPLGCGHGGLRWSEVRPLIEGAFEALPDVTVLLLPTRGCAEAADQPVPTAVPRMTPVELHLWG